MFELFSACLRYVPSQVECDPDHCPVGPLCCNQRLQRQQGPKLRVGQAGSKGYGLFACEDISTGSYVCTYIGEVRLLIFFSACFFS